MGLFRKIIDAGTIGVQQRISPIYFRLVRLTNIFNLMFILISIIVIPLIILLTNEGFQSYIRYLLLIFFCIFNIFLNHRQSYLRAKILTVFSPFILIFVFPIFNQFIHAGMFIWFPYGIMIIGGVSLFIFSFKREKKILIYTLLLFIVATVFYDRILLYTIPNRLELSFVYENNYLYYQTSKILLVLFLYASLYIARTIMYKNRQELTKLNSVLDQKNNELNYMNQNLEKVVKDRTEKLALQNKRIKDLAFTNAHIVRASVARIIGLVNLTNDNASDKEKDFCYIKIRESAIELDIETSKISKELIEEN